MPEVDAHVVEVAAWRGRFLVEGDGSDHLVCRRIDLHQLGATGHDSLEPGVGRVETHRKPLSSATTDCTQTKVAVGSASGDQLFQASSGYGASVPSLRTSTTETGTSRDQRG